MLAVGAVLCTVALLSAAQSPQASAPSNQPPPEATALILGRVVDASSGRPIAGAIVTLRGSVALPEFTGPGPTSTPRAMTNASGQFVFRKLLNGAFMLTASKPGYADGAYGKRRPEGSPAPLKLEPGERAGDVVIPLWRYGSIAGTVTDEAGEPLIGVSVRAFRSRYAAGHRRLIETDFASTDDRGIYRFDSLIPGSYVVAFVSHEASLPTQVVEATRSPAAPGDAAAQALRRETAALGGPMGSPGSPFAMQVGGVVRQINFSAPVPPPGAETGATFIYPTLFYPAAPSAARAALITIASGQERENVDFSLQPIRASRVSGTVVGPDGPVANVALRLVQASGDFQNDLETAVTITGAAGEFTLLGVPAGQYVIKVVRAPGPTTPAPQPQMTQIQVGNSTVFSSSAPASIPGPPPVPDDPTLFAETAVSVADADVSGLVVPLQRGGRLTGRVEFEGARERPDAKTMVRIFIMPERADALSGVNAFLFNPSGHPDGSGAFKTYGLPAGKYLLRVNVPGGGWILKSITNEGRDISDTPIDVKNGDVANVVVTFTDRPTKLEGMAHTADGSADPDALVVVFPQDSGGWTDFGASPRRMRSVRTQKNGAYSLSGLPPGDYYVAAIKDEGQWQDPQVLEELARVASPIRLSDGESKTQDLKTTGGGR